MYIKDSMGYTWGVPQVYPMYPKGYRWGTGGVYPIPGLMWCGFWAKGYMGYTGVQDL